MTPVPALLTPTAFGMIATGRLYIAGWYNGMAILGIPKRVLLLR